MKQAITKLIELRDIQLETTGCSWTLSYSDKRSLWVIRINNHHETFNSSNLITALNLALRWVKETRTRRTTDIKYRL